MNTFLRLYTYSQYKEDYFTDSKAVAYSQDVFIYFLHEAPTCQTPLIRSPLTPLHIPARSQVRRVELVTAPTQGASWLLYDDDADTQLAADVLTRRVPSLSWIPETTSSLNRIMIKPRSLPPTRLDKPWCSSSCWSAPPTWSSTSLPWSTHKYLSLIPLLNSKSTNFNSALCANISKLSFLNKC